MFKEAAILPDEGLQLVCWIDVAREHIRHVRV
jgi:hypothetical protein